MAAAKSKTDSFKCLNAILQVNNKSCDVLLSEKGVSWTSLSGSAKAAKRMSADGTSSHQNNIDYSDVLGIAQIESYKANSSGFDITTVATTKDGQLVDKRVRFSHPDSQLIGSWVAAILKAVKDCCHDMVRPKKVRVYVNSYAGKRSARSVFAGIVNPLFLAAGVETTIIDIESEEDITRDMKRADLSACDCIVCVGGDGTVHKVVNALLNKTQFDNLTEIKGKFQPSKCVTPVGIIPVGCTNQIIASVQGSENVVSATLHIILGHHRPVDVCSVHVRDQLFQWAFISHYGYFGTALKYVDRYAKLGPKKIEAALAKALTKSKFRAYECEIQFIPSPASCGHPNDGKRCIQGCRVCFADERAQEDDEPHCDEVQDFVAPDSDDSASIADSSDKSMWKSMKGTYFGVSVMAVSGICDLAPRGQSKYTHLSDGCLDLVLVRTANRDDFLKYLRRHGTDKSQFSLPIVETKRCSEVRFQVRSNETWKHKDYAFSEVDYEVQRQEKNASLMQKRGSVELVIDTPDLSSSDASDAENKNEEQSEKDSGGKIGHVEHAYVSDKYRPTVLEAERARRHNHKRKKDERRKMEAMDKMKTVWNIDNEMCTEVDHHFRVHRGLLLVCGQGPVSQWEPADVKYGCLSLF